MAEDAVIRLGYDNSKVRAGARETETTMQRTSKNVRLQWVEASKGIKDAFDPLSRGALVKAGGIGVGLFAATTAVDKFISKVHSLAEAPYLSTQQHHQMQVISNFFDEISQRRDEMIAGGIAWFGNELTGGRVYAAAEAESKAEERQKQLELEVKLEQVQKKNRTAALDDAGKLADKREELASVDRRMTGAASDAARLKLEIERETILGQIAEIERDIAKDAASAADARKKDLESIAQMAERTATAAADILPDPEKLDALKKQLASIFEQFDATGGLFADKSASGIQSVAEARTKNGDVEGAKLAYEQLQKVLDLKKAIGELEQKIADDASRNEKKRIEAIREQQDVMLDFRRRHREAREYEAEQQKKAQERQQKAGDILSGIQEMELRASGRDKAADKLARERKIASRAGEIAEELGIDPTSARGIAEQEAKLEERINGRQSRDGSRRRIQGYTSDQRARNPYVDHRTFDQIFNRTKGDIPTPRGQVPQRGPQTGSKTRERDVSAEDSRRLLERIAQGIEELTVA